MRKRAWVAGLVSMLVAGWAGAARAGTVVDGHVWVNVTAIGHGPKAAGLDKALWFAEFQPRFADNGGRLDQWIVRGAAGYQLSPAVQLWQGYARIGLPGANGAADSHEDRAFQQLNWFVGKPWGGELSTRTRLEQRWRPAAKGGGRELGWRVRSMARYEKPVSAKLKGVNALVSAEAFFALDDTSWGARAGFDQLRSFAGAEIGVGGKSTIEIGYLNQWTDQRVRTRVNHVASVSLFWRP